MELVNIPSGYSSIYWSRLNAVWLIYKYVANTTESDRVGFLIDHVRKELPGFLMSERSESVSEHSHKTSLLWAISVLSFPRIFIEDEDSKEYVWEELFLTLVLALIHDAAEGDKRGPGDVADNGCEEHESSKLFEKMAMGELFALFPGSYREVMAEKYDRFESYEPFSQEDVRSDWGTKYDTYRDMSLKLFDKLEPIFSLLRDETRHLYGRVGPDSGPDDLKYAKYLHTDSPTDVWMFSVRKICAQPQIPEKLSKLVYDLALAAFMNVRKNIPECMTADLDGCE